MAIAGAFAFGVVLGWFVYFTNRYRKGEASFADLTTLVGILGGAAVTALFGEAKSDLFGAYGVGLAAGFFAYFISLVALVKGSGGVFNMTWFLDGRRKKPAADEEIPAETRPTTAAMGMRRTSAPVGAMAAMSLDPHAATQESPLARATEELSRTLQAVTQALRDLNEEIGRTTDPGKRSALVAAERLLSQKLDGLVALRLKDLVESQQTRDALAKLNVITGDVVATAKEMKSAADGLSAANRLIDQATKLIGFFAAIV